VYLINSFSMFHAGAAADAALPDVTVAEDGDPAEVVELEDELEDELDEYFWLRLLEAGLCREI
jgi:hypothetical protein